MRNRLTLEQVFEDVGLTAKWEARGRVEGEAKGRTEIARKLKEKGFSLAEVAEITELPSEAVVQL